MLSTRHTKLTLLLTFALALSFTTSVSASPNVAHHRVLRKRAAADDSASLPPLLGAGLLASTTGTDATTTAGTTTAAADATDVTTGASSVTTTTSSSLPSVSNILSASSSAASSAASSSATSSSSSTESTSSTSSVPESTTSAAPTTAEAATTTSAPLSTAVVKGSITTQTQTAAASNETENPAANLTGATGKSSIAVTVLIAIGASLGGIVILWTVFRKWRASRSNKVDTRMQPIDWQPGTFDGAGIPGEHRRHSGSSFHSFSNQGHGSSEDGHGSSHHGHGARTLNPLPEHDFTAGGANNLAPVGGYADLARGPSPRPEMQQMGGGGVYQQDVTPINFKY